MSKRASSQSSPAEHLQQLRDALLVLHKSLVDAERIKYEKTVGIIRSPNHFLQLLTNDPWFAWLHPLSRLIVSMDEALDGKEPLTAAKAGALVNQSGALLVAREEDQGFSGHYFQALQNDPDPDVILAHAHASKLIGRKKRTGG